MSNDTILVTGGTGKTGRHVAARLRALGHDARTAARTGADVHFDWDDPATHGPALAGVGAVYLVPPALRLDGAPAVVGFLDRAEAAGVRHVTYLSARGVENAPPEAQLRAVELDLGRRGGLTHTLLRPGWFMQDFHEAYFVPTRGVIAAPTGDGAEAFVHADDIAAVAVATLLAPADHDRAAYVLTGPEALTFGEVAERVAKAAGRPVVHEDVPRGAWVASAEAAGMPRDYAEALAFLMDELLRSGTGAATTDDVERVTGRPPQSFDDYAAEPDPIAVWSAAA